MAEHGIEVGQKAPEWTLKNTEGQTVTLLQYRGRAVVMFFFRGTWCPNCRKQMEQIRERYDNLKVYAEVIGIVGQGEKEARDYLARNPLPYPMLVDPDRETIKLYGVYQFFGLNGFNVAHPSTIIIDREGVVRYCYVGGQFDRPDLADILTQLQNLYSYSGQ